VRVPNLPKGIKSTDKTSARQTGSEVRGQFFCSGVYERRSAVADRRYRARVALCHLPESL